MSDHSCVPFVSDCHVRAAVDLITHTWDPIVVSALRLGPTRRSDLFARIAGVSDKVLTESLRRLTARGLITRVTGPRAPGAAAVYELTPLGTSFADGPLANLAAWAARYQDELARTS